ncbi:MAG: hypothetical protein WKF58_07025 [Ilumatobacteraceae bacterium]
MAPVTEEGGGTVFDELPIGNPCRGALAAGGLSFRDLPRAREQTGTDRVSPGSMVGGVVPS